MSRRTTGPATLVCAGALLLAGCTGSGGTSAAAPSAPAVAPATTTAPATPAPAKPSPTPGVFDDASVTVAKLGKVPIPTPAPTGVQPLATPGHLQLVAMGDTVVVRPTTGAEAGIVALGPDLTVKPGPAQANGQAPGTIAVTIRVTKGSVLLSPKDFVARNAYTKVTAMTTTARPRTVRAGESATFTFAGEFVNGGAVFEWLPKGRHLVVWDFHVEID